MSLSTSPFIATAVAILYLSFPVNASQGPPKPEDSPAGKQAPRAASSYVIQQKVLRIRIEANGQTTRLLTLRVRVNDDLGVRQWGQIPLPYAPASDDLRIVRLEVLKSGGSTVTVGTDAVQDFAVQQPGPDPVFLDLRQKHITVPSLRPGDTVLLVAEWTVARPLAQHHSWFEYSFTRNAIVDDERLEIDVAGTLSPIVRVEPTAPPPGHVSGGDVVGQRRIYRWQTSNVQPSERSDDHERDEAIPPDVRVTTFGDWQVFAGWIEPLMRAVADGTVKAKAEELTKGLTERRAKIQALYSYVATQIRYVSLSFGIGRFAPHRPADVLKNQYGDCKDKHVLLASLLDAIGVVAVPVLVNTTRSISEDVPSPSEFNHVVTAVPTGDDPAQWTWLDTTLELAPFGLLARQTRDRRVFLPGGPALAPRLLTTPPDGPFPFAETFEIDGKVNTLGVLHANVTIRVRGDTELYLRTLARVMPSEALKEFGDGFAKEMGITGVVSSFVMSDPLATDQPFEIRFSLRRGGYLDWAAPTSKLVVVSGSLELEDFDSERTPLKQDRKLGTSTTHSSKLTIELPRDYAATPPVGVTAAYEGFRYESQYEVRGNRLMAERRHDGRPRTLLAAKAADYTRMARSAAADAAQTFAIKRESKSLPTIPDDMTANELYYAAYSAFSAKDYESAHALWKRNTEVDPKMANAWNGLGSSLHRLRRFKEAIAAFEQQLTLDPSNKQAHGDLASVLQEAGDLSRAAQEYERHVGLNPVDGRGYQSLGDLYRELGQSDKALPALERAAVLLRDNDWVHVLLGATQLDMKQPVKAMASFDRALEISRRPAITTRIAWELADAGESVKKALELADQTISQIATTMAAVGLSNVNETHYDLMEHLAWCWDAHGLIALEESRYDAALRYFDAAWKLGGEPLMAEHLGEAYEHLANRTAEALSAYLIARSLTADPSKWLLDKLRGLSGTPDLEFLHKAAKIEYIRQRTVPLPAGMPKEHAEFLVSSNKQGRIVSAKLVRGSEMMSAAGSRLIGIELPLTVPDSRTSTAIVKLLIACDGAMAQCAGAVTPARIAGAAR